MKTAEVATERYVHKSIQAFLEGEKNLAWISGVLRASDPTKARAVDALRRLANCGDPLRAQTLSDWLRSSVS